MDEKKKNKVSGIILTIIYFALASGLGYMFMRNEDLSAKLEKQEALIKKYNLTDSSYAKDAEKIKEDLNSITSSFSYIKNGKKLSGSALLDYIYQLQNEKDSIQYLYKFAADVYGFKIKQVKRKTKTGSHTTTSTISGTKADSASITYNVFKDRIYRKNGTWYADPTGKKEIEALEKLISDKLMPQAREILKQNQDTVLKGKIE